nr:hypothetical protein AWV80_19070 [Cupriavidus sp. UYMU48A]
MSITGHADGEPGGGPMKVGVAVIDLFTGMYATTAILGALEARWPCLPRDPPCARWRRTGQCS